MAEAQAVQAEKALLAELEREEALLKAAQTAKSNRKGTGKKKGKKSDGEGHPAGGDEEGGAGRREEELEGGGGARQAAPAPAAAAATGGEAILDGQREMARIAEVEAEAGRTL